MGLRRKMVRSKVKGRHEWTGEQYLLAIEAALFIKATTACHRVKSPKASLEELPELILKHDTQVWIR